MQRFLLSSLALAACGVDEPAELAETTSAVVLHDFQTSGQRVRISEVDDVDATTLYITSCGQGVLYSTRSDGTLWFNAKGGLGAWTKVTFSPPGKQIACDRRHLFSFDGSRLYHATVKGTGQLETIWSPTATNDVGTAKTLGVPAGTTQIASGNGNIYATVYANGKATAYTSQLWEQTSPPDHVQGAEDSWVLFGSNLGADRVTGAGSKAWFNAFSDPGGLHHVKRNRAFAASPGIGDEIYFNDHGLDGINTWSTLVSRDRDLPNIQQIAADNSNTMYALVSGGMNQAIGKRILRFSMTESSCHDGLDNDANGLTDAEDSACRDVLATEWCQAHTGSYCIDRLESTDGYDHALVTCPASGRPRVESGRCVHGSTPGTDELAEDRANPEPYGSSHYCSVLHSDGRSAFAWGSDDPCAALLAGHPTSYITRAGIYSTIGRNNVHVTCDDPAHDFVADEGVGDAPLRQARVKLGLTADHCVFTVSPQNMQVFNAPFPRMTWSPPTRLTDGRIVHVYGRGYQVGHVFDHATKCRRNGDPGCPCPWKNCWLDLEPFGNPANTIAQRLDNLGRGLAGDDDNEVAYDYIMNEGVPLRSLGYGRVLPNGGSRDRDVSSYNAGGTPYQGEIYIQYDVGTNPLYRESFVAVYAHVGQRVVVSNQTVEPGQLIGFVGTTGISSRPHVHFGINRITNTNARDTANPGGEAFGYQMTLVPTTTGTGGATESASRSRVDPYGWRVPVDTTSPSAQDPTARLFRRAEIDGSGLIGIGAWSPRLWRADEVPPYPELPPNSF